MASNLVDYVIHWKKKLDKYPDDEDIILRAIHKLSKVPVTPEILEATHIGKTIRNLSKRNDVVGEKAKIVLNKWRNFFVGLQSARNSKQKSKSKKDNGEECSSKHKLTPENIAYHEKISLNKQKEMHSMSPLYNSSLKLFSEKQCNASLFSEFNFDESGEKMFYIKDLNCEQSIEDRVMFNTDCPKTSDDEDKRKSPSLNVSSLKRKLAMEECVNSDPKKCKSGNHSSSNGKIKEKHKIPVDKGESFSHSVKKEKSSPLHSGKHPVDKGESFSHSVKKEKSSPLHSGKQSSSSHSKKVKSDSSKKKADSKTKASAQSSDGVMSFEDCLGFNDVTVKKKKSSKSQSSRKKPHSSSLHSQSKLTDKKVTVSSADKKVIDNSTSKTPKEKLTLNVAKKSAIFDVPKAISSQSAVQPTFKSSQNQSFCPKKERISDEDVIKFTSSRKEKTAIYSGRRSCNRTFPTLAQCCYRVLIENIDILGPMGDTPYNLLKPILEKCSPNQLFDIERYNPHLLYSTNELWEIHCKRDYKLLSPLEHETWRDVYLRGFDEREEKLKHITANISASMSKATPARQLKLAFVETSYVKPPREVLRRQAKHRLLGSSTNAVKPELPPKDKTKKNETATSSTTTNQTFISDKKDKAINDKKDKVKANKSSFSEATNHLPSPKGNTKPVASVVDPTAVDKDIIALSLAAKKPKVAPLMAKSLKTMKQCFRR